MYTRVKCCPMKQVDESAGGQTCPVVFNYMMQKNNCRDRFIFTNMIYFQVLMFLYLIIMEDQEICVLSIIFIVLRYRCPE